MLGVVERLHLGEHVRRLFRGATHGAAPVEAHRRLAGHMLVDDLQEAVLDGALRHVGVEPLDEVERLDRRRAVEGDLELVLRVEGHAAGLMQQCGEVIVGAEVAAQRQGQAGHAWLLLRHRLGGVRQLVPGPAIGIAETELLDDIGLHQQQMALVVGRHDELRTLPVAIVLELKAVDHPRRGVDALRHVVNRLQQALRHELEGDRVLDRDQCRRAARREIGHQLDVDAVPRNRLDLEFQAGRVLLRPFVHALDENPGIGTRLAPYARDALRLRDRRRRKSGRSRRRQRRGSREEPAPADRTGPAIRFLLRHRLSSLFGYVRAVVVAAC